MSVMLLILQLVLAAVLHCAEPHDEEHHHELKQAHDDSWPTAVKLPSSKVIYLPPRDKCLGEDSSSHSILAEHSFPSIEINSGHEHVQSNNSELSTLKTVLPQKYQSKSGDDEWTPQGAACEVSTAFIDHCDPATQEQKSNYSKMLAEDVDAANFSSRRAEMLSRTRMLPLPVYCPISSIGAQPTLPEMQRPFQIPSGLECMHSPYCGSTMSYNGVPRRSFAGNAWRIQQNYPGYGPLNEYPIGNTLSSTPNNQPFHSPSIMPGVSNFAFPNQNEPMLNHFDAKVMNEYPQLEITDETYPSFHKESEHQSNLHLSTPAKEFLDSVLNRIRAQKMSSKKTSKKQFQSAGYRPVEDKDCSCELRHDKFPKGVKYFAPHPYSSHVKNHQSSPAYVNQRMIYRSADKCPGARHQPLASSCLAFACPGGPVSSPSESSLESSVALPISTVCTADPRPFAMPSYSVDLNQQNCFSPISCMAPFNTMTTPEFHCWTPSPACPATTFQFPLFTGLHPHVCEDQRQSENQIQCIPPHQGFPLY